MSLGDHLRADQDPAGRRLERLQRAGPAVEPGRVGVEPQHRETLVAQRCPQLVLDALGSGAMASEGGRATGAAAIGYRLAVATVMTGDDRLRLVEHQRHLAIGTHPHLPTCAA